MTASALPVAIVTGGNSGIGLETVKLLAADHQVYAIGRNQQTLQALEQVTNVIPVALDITDFARSSPRWNGLTRWCIQRRSRYSAPPSPPRQNCGNST